MPAGLRKKLIHPKTTCFAYDGGFCDALVSANCKNCKFYKSKERVQKERQRSAVRLGLAYAVPTVLGK